MKEIELIVISRLGIINDVIYRKIRKNNENKKKYIIYNKRKKQLLKFNLKEKKIIGVTYYIKN